MNALKYQLKNIRRDKMCILTFLLPIVVGIAIHLLSGIRFQTLGETSFGAVKGDLPREAISWLKEKGAYTEYETLKELKDAVREPSTQLIGVLSDGRGLRTLLSGDELTVNKVIGNTLPALYGSRERVMDFHTAVVLPETDRSGLMSLLTAITLVTAMFMGCTFNAMNIIGEKEEGVAFINQILPMPVWTYLLQKIALGFISGFLSSAITALICMKLNSRQLLPFLILMAVSSYIAALTGLFIGRHSEGLMTGIAYIKIVMLFFLVPPILVYLTVPQGSPLFLLSYLLPSSAVFYEFMELLSGQTGNLWSTIAVLLFHAALWSAVYLLRYRRY